MSKKGGNPQYLTPRKKGMPSLNPKGRPKKLPALDVLMAELLGEDEKGQSGAMKILQSLRQMATSGKSTATKARAAEILLDRGYGKPKSDDKLTVKIQSAKDIAESDAKAKEILEKYNLDARVKKVEK